MRARREIIHLMCELLCVKAVLFQDVLTFSTQNSYMIGGKNQISRFGRRAPTQAPQTIPNQT